MMNSKTNYWDKSTVPAHRRQLGELVTCISTTYKMLKHEKNHKDTGGQFQNMYYPEAWQDPQIGRELFNSDESSR